jgi:hypothetical protein
MLTILVVLATLAGPPSTRSGCVANFRTAEQALPLVQVAAIGRLLGMRDTIVEQPWFSLPQEAKIYRIELSYGWRWSKAAVIEVLDPNALSDCGAAYLGGDPILVMADTTAGHFVPLVGAPNGPMTMYPEAISQLGVPLFRR